ncbi:MAG: DUF427 domain-containing protein [Gammaproteobacteria bacterium]|nr:DUF427 domain-containing protein [Gammaproteobacteria bacterium]
MTSSQNSKPNKPVSQATQLYRYTFDTEAKQVSALYQGITLADSSKVMLLQETRIPPVCYFPREDVRIESLCMLLGEPVLLSADFASCCLDHVVSLGDHQLQGIDEPREIFALRANGG